jgi:hypothetical protein
MDNKFDELREALENVDTEKFAENKEDTVDDFSSIGTITIDSSSSFSYGHVGIGSGQFWCSTASNYGNVTIGAAGSSGQFLTSGLNGTSWSTVTANPSLDVSGNANFDGDITWKGRSLGNLLQSIEDRLAILAEPDPVKLEKFAALKKAYDHYKLMEKLIGDE